MAPHISPLASPWFDGPTSHLRSLVPSKLPAKPLPAGRSAGSTLGQGFWALSGCQLSRPAGSGTLLRLPVELLHGTLPLSRPESGAQDRGPIPCGRANRARRHVAQTPLTFTPEGIWPICPLALVPYLILPLSPFLTSLGDCLPGRPLSRPGWGVRDISARRIIGNPR